MSLYSQPVRGPCIQRVHCLFIGRCLDGRNPNAAFSLQYYALQILETVIKTRWKILPRNQCEGRFHSVSCVICSWRTGARNPSSQESACRAVPSPATVGCGGCQVEWFLPLKLSVLRPPPPRCWPRQTIAKLLKCEGKQLEASYGYPDLNCDGITKRTLLSFAVCVCVRDSLQG